MVKRRPARDGCVAAVAARHRRTLAVAPERQRMDHADHEHHPHADDEDVRVTSPMQEFSTGQVGVGFAVLAVGLALTFGVALVLA